MEFRRFLRVIFSYQRMIMLMVVSSMITATVITYLISEKYEGLTKVIIYPQKSVDLVPKREEVLKFPVSLAIPIDTAAKTYTEIIGSRVIAEKVVRRLGLDKPPVEEGWRYVWGKVKSSLKNFARNTWTLLKHGYIKEEDPFSVAVSEVQGGLSVKPTKDSYLFEIRAESKSGSLAATIANTAAQAFVDFQQEQNNSEDAGVRKISKEWVQMSEESLEQARTALKRFKEKNGVVSLKEEGEVKLKLISRLEGSLEAVRADLKGAMAKQEEIKRQLAQRQKYLKSSNKVIDNPLVRALRAQLAEKEVNLQGLREMYAPDHLKVIVLNEEIKEIKNKLHKEAPTLDSETVYAVDPAYLNLMVQGAELESNIESLRAKSNNLQASIQEQENLTRQMPWKEAEIGKFEHDIKLNESAHGLLSQEYEELRMSEAKKSPDIRVVSLAHAPTYPVRPIKIYYAVLAGTLSLITGLGIALFLEHLNPRIRSIEEAERELALPVLMTVPPLNLHGQPYLPRDRRGVPWEKAATGVPPIRAVRNPDFEEPVRSLMVHLQSLKSQGMSAFLVTSNSPREGKSAIVSQLAVAGVELGKKVVLIDANLRGPSLSNLFGLPPEPGLSDFLSRGVEPVLHQVIGGPKVLTSGAAVYDPPGLLDSERMRQLLGVLAKDFEFVLVDSPPLSAGPDAALLSAMTHGTFLILSPELTSLEEGKRAKKILERAQANIVGVALNYYEDRLGSFPWKSREQDGETGQKHGLETS